MIEKPTQPTQGGPDGSIQVSDEDRRRELELELIKIRSEAEAARLDAKAAELELTIRRLSRSVNTDSQSLRVDAPDVQQPTQRSTTADLIASSSVQVEFDPSPSASTKPVTVADTADNDFVAPAFSSWDAVRSATSARPMSPQNAPAAATGSQSTTPINRIDTGSPDIKAPNFLREPVETESNPNDQWDTVAPEDLQLPQTAATQDVAPRADSESEAVGTPQPFVLATLDSVSDNIDVGPVAIAAEADDEQSQRRRSPAALLISTVVHVLILVALAALTLSAHDPKDQIALSASVSEPSEQAMETFQIETSQPESEPTEPTPSEAEYDLSPVGEVAVTDFQPDAAPAPPAPSTSSMLSSQMSAAAMSLQSDSDAKIQFCGVEGGGNHFVYLVDSSGSMGDGFESARAELLSSIDVLKPDQRFYVVFFDAAPDYMRVSDPQQDDSRSVFATPENKQALKRWAMRISKNTGRAPYDPLKFALELQPDVIFLLSDGEFPQGIEDLLKERNRVENLFGDSGPISIVHTIGYHSREGESRMRRIAEQNQGQYRHVPKP